MQLKEFKDTEVGCIPKDWNVRPLLNLVSIANGQVSPLAEPYRSMILVAPDHIESRTGRLLAVGGGMKVGEKRRFEIPSSRS